MLWNGRMEWVCAAGTKQVELHENEGGKESQIQVWEFIILGNQEVVMRLEDERDFVKLKTDSVSNQKFGKQWVWRSDWGLFGYRQNMVAVGDCAGCWDEKYEKGLVTSWNSLSIHIDVVRYNE